MHGSRSRVKGSASHSWNFFNKVIELTQSELMGNRHWNFEKIRLWGKKYPYPPKKNHELRLEGIYAPEKGEATPP